LALLTDADLNALCIILGVAFGAIFTGIVFHEKMPWAKRLKNLHHPKYRYQSTPYDSYGWTVVGAVILNSIVLFCLNFVVGLSAEYDVIESGLALIALTPLGTFKIFTIDLGVRHRELKLGNDDWRREPLNAKIYLVDAVASVASCAVSLAAYMLTQYYFRTLDEYGDLILVF
jgi:hypothetical protein